MPRLTIAVSFLTLALGTLGSALPARAARLPMSVVPVAQSILLHVDADSAEYSGTVRIELDVREAVSQVQLHSDGQELGRLSLVQSGKPIPVQQERGPKGLLTLSSQSPLAKGPATLEIDFTKAFDTHAVALYRMERDGAGYTFTQFEAEHAREAFPCWDEPIFKFPYQITLEIPARHEAVSNTPIESTTPKGAWKTLVFKKTPPLPSYLLSIATGPLEFTPIPKMKVPTRVVTVKGQSALTGDAVRSTPAILAALEAYFGTPYPFEKLDLIAVPEYWAGAMENPGAITYADNILLGDPKLVSPAHQKTLQRVTAHELAHMWFGDLVTMKWWDDMWLNESFADWLGDKITEQTAPQFQHQLTELQDVQRIMETDARPSTEPIRLHAESGDDAMRAVQVAYNKGKSVLAMFEQWMNPKVFKQGVRDYVAQYSWKNAEAADLWSALGKASGRDVAGMMKPFIEQPGLPLVTVEWVSGHVVRLSQKRFLNHGVEAPPLTWQIPVTLLYRDQGQVSSFSVVLGPEPQEVKLGSSDPIWVMPNAGARGYYRWSVPPNMLNALLQDARGNLSSAERISLVGNLLALLDAGLVHGDVYLRALAQLADDPEPVVVSAVMDAMEKARLTFVTDDLREPFSSYVRSALKPSVDRFGWKKKMRELEPVSLMRPELLLWMGRDGRDAASLELAGTIATQHLTDPGSADPVLAPVALQLNALNGDQALYERYRKAFEESRDPTVRQRYLAALGYFSDPKLEDQALQYSIGSSVRPNESSAITRSMAMRSERSADHAFAFMKENFDKIGARLPKDFWPFLARYGGGCSAERYAASKAFFSDPSRSVPGMALSVEKTGEQVGDCVSLREREGPAVAAYLRQVAGKN